MLVVVGTGLREVKRARTVRAIVDAAMDLFAGRAFEDVSIDEIAAAAGIGRRTFFRYFPTKEDLLLDRRRIDRAYAARALLERAAEEDDVAAVMRVLAELQRRMATSIRPEDQREVHRLTHTRPALAARSWLLMEDVRAALVDALVPDRDRDPDRLLRARLLVSACIMSMDVSVTTWIEGDMRTDLGDIVASAAEQLRRGFAGAELGA